jgi:UDP-N-acetylmuramate--alanine ligase
MDIQPEYRAEELRLNLKGCFDYCFRYGEQQVEKVSLAVPGLHNVKNSLAALAVTHLLDLPVKLACEALADFSGTGRRFQFIDEVDGVAAVDDYAHHPSEIRATLSAARQRFPGRNVWAVWQPHTYSRTKELFDDFLSAFGEADHVIVTEVFPAREIPDPNFSAASIVRAMNHEDAVFLADLSAVSDHLLTRLRSGDVLIVLSAGDANQVIEQFLANRSVNGR